MATTPAPTDAELDTLIKARLNLIGIDLTQLPENDPTAPADQTRIMASLRSFLRSTPPVISNYKADPQKAIPAVYTAPFSAWTEIGR